MTTNTKILITYGTFDLFHIGHLRLLKRLKKQCDTLIVGISTDEFNSQKGKKSLIPFEQRSEIVQSIKYVDIVLPEKDWEQKIHDIKKYDVNIFAIGNDWEGKFDFLNEYCKVIYLERTKEVSTKDLKKSLQSFSAIPKEDILKAFDILEQLRNDFQ